jgi:hypothetical protein
MSGMQISKNFAEMMRTGFLASRVADSRRIRDAEAEIPMLWAFGSRTLNFLNPDLGQVEFAGCALESSDQRAMSDDGWPHAVVKASAAFVFPKPVSPMRSIFSGDVFV